MAESMLWPVLDDVDDAIFRVGHAYRNRVYHADHHNPAVLPLITTAYMSAVGTSFVRFQPKNVGSSWTATTAKLAKYGYVPSEDVRLGSFFRPAPAAEAILAYLVAKLTLSLVEARDSLQADLIARTTWADAMVEDLLKQGMPKGRLEWSLRWGEFWEIAGVDPTVVGLDRKLSDLWVSMLGNAVENDSRFKERNDLLGERNARVAELAEDFKSKFDLGDVQRIKRLAERLDSARSLGHLFDRYRHLDQKMELIEGQLDYAAIGWDRMVQMAEDEARGK